MVDYGVFKLWHSSENQSYMLLAHPPLVDGSYTLSRTGRKVAVVWRGP